MAHSPPNYAISVLGSAGGAVDPTTITPDKDGNYVSRGIYSRLYISTPANANCSRQSCTTTASRPIVWLDPSMAYLLEYSHTLGCSCESCFPVDALETCPRELTDESRFVEFMAEMKRPNDFLKACVRASNIHILAMLNELSIVCGEHSSSFVQSTSCTVRTYTIGKCFNHQKTNMKLVLIFCATKQARTVSTTPLHH
jgi:hypothetical protein